jgi:hypothetical protein
MKKCLLILILMVFTGTGLFAQQISVKSFRMLENDLTARVEAPKKDQNGDVCAIIKVVTTQTGFIWEPDWLGIISAEYKGGEYWLYVPFGAKRLTIKHPQLGVLRDFFYNMPIEKATVYELVLTTGKVTTKVEEVEIESQWLIIDSDPAGADVFINNQAVGKTPFQNELPVGKYTWRVQKDLYINDAGVLELVSGGEKHKVFVTLKRNSGSIDVNSSPESGALVKINGISTGQKTPCKLTDIPTGEQTISVSLDMYEPESQRFVLNAGETKQLNFQLKPTFAAVTVETDNQAEIYINGSFKSSGRWSGRLLQGVYTFEARKEKHSPASERKALVVGDTLTIRLLPQPRYGMLKIISNPIDANIFVDGKLVGQTPLTLKNQLIGEYKVELSKPGFPSKSEKVTINEGETTTLNTRLREDLPLTQTLQQTVNPITTEDQSNGNTSLSLQKDSLKNEKPFVDKNQLPKQTIKLNTFILAGVSYPLMQTAAGGMAQNDLSYSLKLAFAKKLGVYAGITSTKSQEVLDYTYQNQPLEYYSKGISATGYNRLGLTGGLMLNSKAFSVYAGGGWGYFNHYTVTDLYSYATDNLYKKVKYGDKNSYSGFETEAGLVMKLKPMTLHVGVSSVKFTYFEVKAGIGVFF